MKMTKNMRISLALLIVGLAFFMLGCDDSVSVNMEGKIEDWNVVGVDTAIEDAAGPILDFGDSVVEFARDTEEDILSDLWGINAK